MTRLSVHEANHQGSEMKSRNPDGLTMAKETASHMRRSSVGEKDSERPSFSYKSNATSIQASVGGENLKKGTPITKR